MMRMRIRAQTGRGQQREQGGEMERRGGTRLRATFTRFLAWKGMQANERLSGRTAERVSIHLNAYSVVCFNTISHIVSPYLDK